MTFRADIEAIYRGHGPNRITPFVGKMYEKRHGPRFRIAVVGINAYVSPPDWKPGEMTPWSRNWWANAGLGKKRPETWPFHERAYEEVQRLSIALLRDSKLFRGLEYDVDPASKSDLFATKAIKVYTGEAFKEAAAIPAELIWGYAPTWHAELDAMAERGVFPRVIVILGECIWELAWMALHEKYRPAYRHLEVLDYKTIGVEDSASYHHVNRLRVRTADDEHDVLLVRLHHPSAHSKVQKRAEWLLAQEDFRTIARM